MIDSAEIDDVQAAQIGRRIGQAFALVRVAVAHPDIMDVFEDGADVDIKAVAPNTHLPESAFIVAGKTSPGEALSVAVGLCECNTNDGLDSENFWLRVGEQWSCATYRRVSAFDGERLTVTEGADAMAR